MPESVTLFCFQGLTWNSLALRMTVCEWVKLFTGRCCVWNWIEFILQSVTLVERRLRSTLRSEMCASKFCELLEILISLVKCPVLAVLECSGFIWKMYTHRHEKRTLGNFDPIKSVITFFFFVDFDDFFNNFQVNYSSSYYTPKVQKKVLGFLF